MFGWRSILDAAWMTGASVHCKSRKAHRRYCSKKGDWTFFRIIKTPPPPHHPLPFTPSSPLILSTIRLYSKKGIFWIFVFYVRYSTLLHLPPLRFHFVGWCWVLRLLALAGRRSSHSARPHPRDYTPSFHLHCSYSPLPPFLLSIIPFPLPNSRFTPSPSFDFHPHSAESPPSPLTFHVLFWISENFLSAAPVFSISVTLPFHFLPAQFVLVLPFQRIQFFRMFFV